MITFPLYSSSDTLLPAMSVAVSAYRLSAAAERGKRTNAIRNPSITMSIVQQEGAPQTFAERKHWGLKGAWLKLPRVATEMDVTKESELSILCNQLVRNNDK